MANHIPRFSKQTIEFIKKAHRQKRLDWLDRNRAEYEKKLLLPLQRLARHLKSELGPLAPHYNFPQKGIGRMKGGDRVYKSWMSYSAARPRVSRFETNPNIFFLINTEDAKDPVLIAGGLYMPSSRQLRALRETVARDASAFDALFATKNFARRFPGGFSLEKIATRVPRGFEPDHPRLNWIKLQAFFVWRPYTMKEFTSADFPQIVANDGEQIIRMNKLIETALQGRLPTQEPRIGPRKSSLLDRLEGLAQVDQRRMQWK